MLFDLNLLHFSWTVSGSLL